MYYDMCKHLEHSCLIYNGLPYLRVSSTILVLDYDWYVTSALRLFFSTRLLHVEMKRSEVRQIAGIRPDPDPA